MLIRVAIISTDDCCSTRHGPWYTTSQVTGCDNSSRLGSPYFSFIDEESDLMSGLSQFQAHVVNADQGGCELESS